MRALVRRSGMLSGFVTLLISVTDCAPASAAPVLIISTQFRKFSKYSRTTAAKPNTNYKERRTINFTTAAVAHALLPSWRGWRATLGQAPSLAVKPAEPTVRDPDAAAGHFPDSEENKLTQLTGSLRGKPGGTDGTDDRFLSSVERLAWRELDTDHQKRWSVPPLGHPNMDQPNFHDLRSSESPRGSSSGGQSRAGGQEGQPELYRPGQRSAGRRSRYAAKRRRPG